MPPRHDLTTVTVPITTLRPHPRNPRNGDTDVIAESLDVNGQYAPIVVARDGTVLVGNHRYAAALELGWESIAVIRLDLGPDDPEALRIMVADNGTSDRAKNDDALLLELLLELDAGATLTGTSFDDDSLDYLKRLTGAQAHGALDLGASTATLAERFMLPPFTVLDARQGWWQDRKRAWVGLGIRSELGRDEAASINMETVDTRRTLAQGPTAHRGPDGGLVYENMPGTSYVSIFDPVLCEVAYRWFCPPGGAVLDPYAGGSVRGIVAGRLGLTYTGVELRPEQVAANVEQARDLLPDTPARTAFDPDEGSTDDPTALTPVQRWGDYWVKRDDLFVVGGSRGGKVRTCLALAAAAPDTPGLVTAGSRHSPQVNIVAGVAAHLGLGARVHVPEGPATAELLAAEAAGADVHRHQAGRNTVIVARAREDAKEQGWLNIPFGMECAEAVTQTGTQVRDLPEDVARVVVPVGSGMSLAGILSALDPTIPVLGVVVGADPTARLDTYAPGWRDRVTLVQSGSDYADPAPVTDLHGLPLDPHYEAKCLPHLRAGDLLWVVGRRETAGPSVARIGAAAWICGDSTVELPRLPSESADLVFSCPPYYDLESYSDDPRDLSAMSTEEFDAAYAGHLAECARILRSDRFAVMVVGNVRDKHGTLRDLGGVTTRAMEAAGLRLCNDAILVTAVGSASMRAARQFVASRSLGRTHQQVLVYVKGSRKAAAEACGVVDTSDALNEVVTVDDEP